MTDYQQIHPVKKYYCEVLLKYYYKVSYYEDALNKSGYKTQLEYKAPPTSINRNSKNRKRKIVWFNPLYNQSVSTNVAQTFLKLVDKHFPRSNRLNKIFNRNTIAAQIA